MSITVLDKLGEAMFMFIKSPFSHQSGMLRDQTDDKL